MSIASEIRSAILFGCTQHCDGPYSLGIDVLQYEANTHSFLCPRFDWAVSLHHFQRLSILPRSGVKLSEVRRHLVGRYFN